LDVGALVYAPLSDIGKAKAYLPMLGLFVHAAGRETLRALAVPLAQPELPEYEEPNVEMGLLLAVRHEVYRVHWMEMLTVLTGLHCKHHAHSNLVHYVAFDTYSFTG
jgi:hypothetical protein